MEVNSMAYKHMAELRVDRWCHCSIRHAGMEADGQPIEICNLNTIHFWMILLHVVFKRHTIVHLIVFKGNSKENPKTSKHMVRPFSRWESNPEVPKKIRVSPGVFSHFRWPQLDLMRAQFSSGFTGASGPDGWLLFIPLRLPKKGPSMLRNRSRHSALALAISAVLVGLEWGRVQLEST